MSEPTATCLVCEAILHMEPGIPDVVYDGGWMVVHFGYGSVHDTGPGPSAVRLLNCDEIHAYLCDGCFTKRRHLMRGYHQARPKLTETVPPQPESNS